MSPKGTSYAGKPTVKKKSKPKKPSPKRPAKSGKGKKR